jgi:integrase
MVSPKFSYASDSERDDEITGMLQELLGHKSLAMIQRYSHQAPEKLQNEVKMLGGVIGEKQELVGQPGA